MSGGTGDDVELYGGGINLINGEGNDYLNGGFGNDVMFIGRTMVIIQLQMKEVKEIACTYLILALMNIAFKKKVGNDVLINKAINGVLWFDESMMWMG